MSHIRADTVTIFVFRRRAGRVEFLQLRRAKPPHRGTWQPVMGGIDPGETAPQTARRELREETGMAPDSSACPGFWALDRVFPFYRAETDVVILSPTFAAEAAEDWEPALNAENDAARWIAAADLEDAFVWPGHTASCREILHTLLRPGSPAEPLRRVTPSERPPPAPRTDP